MTPLGDGGGFSQVTVEIMPELQHIAFRQRFGQRFFAGKTSGGIGSVDAADQVGEVGGSGFQLHQEMLRVLRWFISFLDAGYAYQTLFDQLYPALIIGPSNEGFCKFH